MIVTSFCSLDIDLCLEVLRLQSPRVCRAAASGVRIRLHLDPPRGSLSRLSRPCSWFERQEIRCSKMKVGASAGLRNAGTCDATKRGLVLERRLS